MNRQQVMQRPLLMGLDEEYEVHPNGAAAAMLATLPKVVPCLADGAHGGNGWATAGGGIFYLDYHERLEAAGPECTCPAELLRAQRASDEALVRAARRLQEQEGTPIRLFRASVDDVAGSTAGSHCSTLFEGSLLSRETLAAELTAWSVGSRLLTGAGGFDWRSRHGFVVAARSRFMEHVISSESTHARGINHTREESLVAEGSSLEREHYLLEDCNRSGWSVAFRFLRPVLIRLLECGVRFDLQLQSPLAALRAVVEDATGQTRLRLQDGRSYTSVELLQAYLEQVRAWVGYRDFPDWVEGLVAAAEACLQSLQRQGREPTSASSFEPWDLRLDWAIKKAFFEEYMARQGVSWETFRTAGALLVEPRWFTALPDRMRPDRVRQSLGDSFPFFEQRRASLNLSWQALERLYPVVAEVLALNKKYHELGPASLYEQWKQAGLVEDSFLTEEEVKAALTTPPSTTRAWARGQGVAELATAGREGWATWTAVIDATQGRMADLGFPFQTELLWQSQPQLAEREQGRPRSRRHRSGGFPWIELLREEVFRNERTP
jgi:hypothetical protein